MALELGRHTFYSRSTLLFPNRKSIHHLSLPGRSGPLSGAGSAGRAGGGAGGAGRKRGGGDSGRGPASAAPPQQRPRSSSRSALRGRRQAEGAGPGRGDGRGSRASGACGRPGEEPELGGGAGARGLVRSRCPGAEEAEWDTRRVARSCSTASVGWGLFGRRVTLVYRCSRTSRETGGANPANPDSSLRALGTPAPEGDGREVAQLLGTDLGRGLGVLPPASLLEPEITRSLGPDTLAFRSPLGSHPVWPLRRSFTAQRPGQDSDVWARQSRSTPDRFSFLVFHLSMPPTHTAAALFTHFSPLSSGLRIFLNTSRSLLMVYF